MQLALFKIYLKNILTGLSCLKESSLMIVCPYLNRVVEGQSMFLNL